MLFATNMTTNEIKFFEDTKTIEFEKFARQAVFDFCIDCFDGEEITAEVGGKFIEINEDSCELDFWQFCAILYCKCKVNDEWGDILQINEIVDEED